MDTPYIFFFTLRPLAQTPTDLETKKAGGGVPGTRSWSKSPLSPGAPATSSRYLLLLFIGSALPFFHGYQAPRFVQVLNGYHSRTPPS